MLLFVAVQLIIQIYTLNYCVDGSIINSTLIYEGSASTYFRWSGQFR